jgi:outer membrane receptor for ferrienterochelin and colicins
LVAAGLPLHALAQTPAKTGVLKGVVMDKETGETLPGVAVNVVGTYFAAVTDGKGQFVFPRIPSGDYSVKFQMMGYGTAVHNGITIKTGATTVHDARLSTKAEALQTVTVTGNKAQVD